MGGGASRDDLIVPFDHNDHYHPLLLNLIPADARRAPDVGRGTGTFARAVAGRGRFGDSPGVRAGRTANVRLCLKRPI